MHQIASWMREVCRTSGIRIARTLVLDCDCLPESNSIFLKSLQVGLEEYRRSLAARKRRSKGSNRS
jgi:hypothetical protein